ncbi:hypothetical protein PM8797T_10389 [Gimesia maris DSM 8797]|nr:hypothetical protein PM8797T_10389 [Gimesia maris DSM 8797]
MQIRPALKFVRTSFYQILVRKEDRLSPAHWLWQKKAHGWGGISAGRIRCNIYNLPGIQSFSQTILEPFLFLDFRNWISRADMKYQADCMD